MQMSEPALETLTDEELAVLARDSVEAEGVLLSRYLRLIRFHAGRFVTDGDTDDLVQEGLIALLQAIPRYDASLGKRFSAFAQVCIANRMRSFMRQEQKAETPAEDLIENLDAQGELADPVNPESIFMEKESFRETQMQVMAMLSDREWEILQCIMDGMSYAQAAEKLGTGVKAIDNAMQRIRRKMRAVRSADHSEDSN